MSTFKKWLLLVIVAVALFHTFGGSLADVFGGGTSLFTPAHGWNEGVIYMLLAIVRVNYVKYIPRKAWKNQAMAREIFMDTQPLWAPRKPQIPPVSRSEKRCG